ncbi:hypothetical protein EAO27_13450 [Sphingopyxis sp. YF1]|uniref:hypothetical protein n=1 Tax=Sphingopyxis sp. YF1 TaxID=2482763 RepID=UPI001F60120C|nr:hypothetical protein [Sphingopyxis sp. YF1]UNU43614.1 hypothetical protein EAO27_13450 [Sphingopyxis sp. YF1]
MKTLSDFYQLAIIAFILAGVFIAWRAGQQNPEGTGRIARRISRVEQELQGKATTEDVAALKAALARVDANIAAEHELNARTFLAVTRIESFLIEKALKGE